MINLISSAATLFFFKALFTFLLSVIAYSICSKPGKVAWVVFGLMEAAIIWMIWIIR